MTGTPQWGLIRLPDGGIVGVHSLSDRAPFPRKTVLAGFDVPLTATYRGWRFIAPSAAALLAPPAASAATAPAPAGLAPGQPTAATAATPAAQSRSTDSQAETSPSDAAVTTRLPRPRQDDFRSRTADACSRIAAYEEQVCREQTSRFGEAAGRACQDSALARNLACLLTRSWLCSSVNRAFAPALLNVQTPLRELSSKPAQTKYCRAQCT